MTNQHPITPPPELVKEWIQEADGGHDPRWQEYEQDIANRGAQWGADQELEACCEWLSTQRIADALCSYDLDFIADDLRAARRPKPPSLKEEALKELAWVDKHLNMPLHNHCNAIHTIRRALEALPDD